MTTAGIYLAAALACALVLTSPVSAVAADSAEKMEDQAYEAYKRGDLKEALRFYREAHRMDPAPALLNNIARVCQDLGLYRDAFEAYQQVVNDPEADPNTRSRDAARMALLAPRLTHGWLRLMATPVDAALLVDGKKPDWGADNEAQLAPGTHQLELTATTLGVTRVWTTSLPAGQRTTLRVDLNDPDHVEAGVVFGEMPADLTAVSVDGYMLRSPPTQWMKLRFLAGSHVLTFHLPDGQKLERKEDFAPGTNVGVHLLMERARAAAPAKPPSTGGPTTVVRASAEPPSHTLEWALMGGGGAALVGAAVVAVLRQSDLTTMDEATERWNDQSLGHDIKSQAFEDVATAQAAADAKRLPMALLGVTGVGLAATGAVLLLTGDAAAPPDDAARATGPSLTPFFSGHLLGLWGTF